MMNSRVCSYLIHKMLLSARTPHQRPSPMGDTRINTLHSFEFKRNNNSLFLLGSYFSGFFNTIGIPPYVTRRQHDPVEKNSTNSRLEVEEEYCTLVFYYPVYPTHGMGMNTVPF